MDKKELFEFLDSRESFELLPAKIIENPILYETLMELALYSPEQKSWRAAYLVEKINDVEPAFIQPYLNKMVEQLKHEKSSSKKRHFLKLLSLNTIEENQLGYLLDYCVEVISSDEPVAVRVHAMQILYNISEKEPELKAEILALIEHEMEYRATAGITSRGKRLAQKLRKQLNVH